MKHFIRKQPLEIIDQRAYRLDGQVEQILSAGLDPSEELTLWVVVDVDAPPTWVSVSVVTGNSYPDGLSPDTFVGSVLHGRFVWHVFAERAP